MTRPVFAPRRALLSVLALLLLGAPVAATTRIEALPSNRITSIQPFPDGLLLGTARGVFALTGAETGRMLPGLDAFVFAMAEERGVILIATDTGAIMLRQGALRSAAAPAEWRAPTLMAAAAADGVFVAGGAEGVVTISPEGVVRTLSGPGGGLLAAAAAPNRNHLLLAFDGALHLFKPRSGEWLRLDVGRSHVALVFGEDGRWFGLDRGGGLHTGRAVPGAATIRIAGLPPDDVALAIASRPADGALLIGTLRGRILAARFDERRGRVAVERLLDDPDHARPIRTLTVTEAGVIAAGTDGAGLILLAADGSIRQLVSGQDREERPELAPAPEADLGADMRRALTEKTAELFERAAQQWRLVAGAGAAVLFTLLLLYFALARGAAKDGRVREKRRTSRTPLDLPAIEELTPEIGALALSFMSIANEINDLSRAAAKGGAAEHAEKARRVTSSFEETERKMREHFNGLDDLRAANTQRLERLKARIRAGEAPEAENLQEELETLERAMAQLEKDERYLRYVLDE